MSSQLSGISFRQIRSSPLGNRPMKSGDGFIYNFLSMGVMFPWIYAYGPALSEHANLFWAIFLTLLAQIPISLSYAFLATVLPVSGGDYIYQTRAFGSTGFVVVMSGFVLWILAWIPLSGMLFVKLGLAPLLYSIGGVQNEILACKLQTPYGLFSATLLLAALAIFVLMKGLRVFALIQRFLFALTLAAIVAVLWIFHTHTATFDGDINSYVSGLLPGLLDHNLIDKSTRAVLTSNFLTCLNASSAVRTSVLATFGAMPLAWISLQWSTYSVEQSTEISGADKFRKEIFMLVMSAVLVAALFILIGKSEAASVPAGFMRAASAKYVAPNPLNLDAAADVVQTLLPPFPHVIAMAITKNFFLKMIICLGVLANAFQIFCNCFIGMTRIMMAMTVDGMLPRWVATGKRPLRSPSPFRAHFTYLLFSIPVAYIFFFVENSGDLFAVMTTILGCDVIVITALAAARIPARRMRNFWMCSSVNSVPANVFIACGYLGAFIGAVMFLLYFRVIPTTVDKHQILVAYILTLVIAYLISLWARALRPEIRDRLRNVPREIHDFSISGQLRERPPS